MPNGKFCQACCWIEYTQNQIETLKKFSLFYFESIFSLWSCQELARPGLASLVISENVDRSWENHLSLRNCCSPITFTSVSLWGFVWNFKLGSTEVNEGRARGGCTTNSEVHFHCRKAKILCKYLHLWRILLPPNPPQLPRGLSGKESACQCRKCRFDPWMEKIPWRRKWQPTPVFLPGRTEEAGSTHPPQPHPHWERISVFKTREELVFIEKFFKCSQSRAKIISMFMTQAFKTVWVNSKPGLARFVSILWAKHDLDYKFLWGSRMELKDSVISLSEAAGEIPNMKNRRDLLPQFLVWHLAQNKECAAKEKSFPEVWKGLAACEVQAWEWLKWGRPAKPSLFEVRSVDFLNISNKQNSAGNGSQMHFLTQEFLGRRVENNHTTSSGSILALLLDQLPWTIPLTCMQRKW